MWSTIQLRLMSPLFAVAVIFCVSLSCDPEDVFCLEVFAETWPELHPIDASRIIAARANLMSREVWMVRDFMVFAPSVWTNPCDRRSFLDHGNVVVKIIQIAIRCLSALIQN